MKQQHLSLGHELKIMKQLIILICTATSLAANFDVQTSWLRNSSIDSAGTALQPDTVDQSITGDPLSQYDEDYRETAAREDNGDFSFSTLEYQISSTSSPTGTVGSYNYASSTDTFFQISGSGTSTLTYSYATSSVFTTSESFLLDSTLFTIGGVTQNFSLFVDDILLWSGLSGFSAIPVPDEGGGSGEIAALYGKDTGFELDVLGFGANPTSGGLRGLQINAAFDESEPEHKFEIRFDWSRTDTTGSGGGIALFAYDLDLAAVPEPSAQFLIIFSLLAALGIRRHRS